jgi:type IX secretion system PorP/SprF family membrane protein
MKLSLHAGYRIDLASLNKGVYIDKDISITPTLLYRMQGKSDQLDLGVYMNYEPITFGLWYRGVPVKIYTARGLDQFDAPTQFRSNDAVAFMMGIKKSQFSFVYSYDLTISSLAQRNTGGAHELSITYYIPTNFDYSKNKPRYGRFGRIYCPNPWKRYQRLK